jgi:tRNA A37 methylthiotransferase MiaB
MPVLEDAALPSGFKTIYREKTGGLRFTELLDKVSLACPNVRFKFTSPHPKDFPDDLLHLMNERFNIASQIHMPAQSGSSHMLDKMRRGYDRESYLRLVERIRSIVPNVSLSSDFISGFCDESEADHLDTLSLLDTVKYDQCFMVKLSLLK